MSQSDSRTYSWSMAIGDQFTLEADEARRLIGTEGELTEDDWREAALVFVGETGGPSPDLGFDVGLERVS